MQIGSGICCCVEVIDIHFWHVKEVFTEQKQIIKPKSCHLQYKKRCIQRPCFARNFGEAGSVRINAYAEIHFLPPFELITKTSEELTSAGETSGPESEGRYSKMERGCLPCYSSTEWTYWFWEAGWERHEVLWHRELNGPLWHQHSVLKC